MISEPITTTTTPFLFLALDLPPPPLFQEDLEKSIIPQVPLVHLLTKFDGVTWKVIMFCFFFKFFLVGARERDRREGRERERERRKGGRFA